MAEVVIGIGASHTPMISMGASSWSGHVASWDVRLPGYEEAAASAPDWLREEVTPEKFEHVYAECQRNLDHLRDALAAADPDVVIVFGDDQEELFVDDGIPTLAFFGGDALLDLPNTRKLSASRQAAEWAFHGAEPSSIVTHGAFGKYLAETFAASGLCPHFLMRQPEGRTVGHAFTFISRRLAIEPRWSLVPVWLNTYYPPNQVAPLTAYRIGQMVREAVSQWPSDARVAIVASGGLSHFYVNEELDRSVLDAIRTHDHGALCSLDPKELQSGTSEILNWVAAAGSLDDFEVAWERYVPAYRSLAATGVGVASVIWSPA